MFPSTRPATLGEMESNQQVGTPALKLLVRGFDANPMERRLLSGTVMLSQRRQPRLELLDDAKGQTADVVLIDAQDAKAMAWADEQEWLKHKAVIWVDAKSAPDKHTVTRRPVQWPILPMLLARAMEQGPKRPSDTGHGLPTASAPAESAVQRRVLVVDDSLAVRMHLRSVLEASGIVVDEAADAARGIAASAAAPYACILMDVMMPGIDGYEACRRIKGRAAGGPAIIMLTSKSSPFDRIRGKMAGCDAYLTKPVDPKELKAVLARYLGGQVLSTHAASPSFTAPPRLAM